MIEISKIEAFAIRNKIKDIHICKTKRKCYVEETMNVMNLLHEIRNNHK